MVELTNKPKTDARLDPRFHQATLYASLGDFVHADANDTRDVLPSPVWTEAELLERGRPIRDMSYLGIFQVNDIFYRAFALLEDDAGRPSLFPYLRRGSDADAASYGADELVQALEFVIDFRSPSRLAMPSTVSDLARHLCKSLKTTRERLRFASTLAAHMLPPASVTTAQQANEFLSAASLSRQEFLGAIRSMCGEPGGLDLLRQAMRQGRIVGGEGPDMYVLSVLPTYLQTAEAHTVFDNLLHHALTAYDTRGCIFFAHDDKRGI